MASESVEPVRSGAAVAGYAIGLGAIVAALLTVVLFYAAPSFPWIASVAIGGAAGGALGMVVGRQRGVDV